MKHAVISFLFAIVLSLSGAHFLPDYLSAVILPYVATDNFDPIPNTANVLLINERAETHHWEFSLSDESVLHCVGMEIQKKTVKFDFSGRMPGVCEVTFRYKRYGATDAETLLTEVFRFFVDESLGVTYEHVYFSTNER